MIGEVMKMNEFIAIVQNKVLISSGLSWLCAQVLKTIIHALVNGKLDMERLTGDGGMPSGHSATVTALAVSSGCIYGFDSAAFAIASILAIVVMHDAMGVRLEAGKHAKALNVILKEYMELPQDQQLKEFLGHTPLQVVCGAILGLFVALIFCFFI